MVKPASSQMDAQTHAELKEYFAADVGKLEDLLQRDLSGWRVESPVAGAKA